MGMRRYLASSPNLVLCCSLSNSFRLNICAMVEQSFISVFEGSGYDSVAPGEALGAPVSGPVHRAVDRAVRYALR